MKLHLLSLFFLKHVFAQTFNQSALGNFFIFEEHPRGKRAILVNNDPSEPCRIYGHSNPIQVIENLQDGPSLRTVTQQEWLTISADCQERLLSLTHKPLMPKPVSFGSQLDLIFPGTKWCGAGDVANDFDDLGPHAATDMCCRDHDFCQDTMKPSTCKYGLCNTAPFTKSHCDCDDKFRECLMNAADDSASLAVGFIFFDVAAISCYRQTPECIDNVLHQEPIELTRRKRTREHLGKTLNQEPRSDRWCFIPPKPFKKPVILSPANRRTQPDILRHVLSTASDVTTMVKRVTGSTMGSHHGK